MPSFQIRQPGQLINLRFASAKIVNHTPFSASRGVASYYAASKNQYYKRFSTLNSAKSYFLRFYQAYKFHLCALELKVCEKSGTLSAFCVNRDTTRTNAKIPGHLATMPPKSVLKITKSMLYYCMCTCNYDTQNLTKYYHSLFTTCTYN